MANTGELLGASVRLYLLEAVEGRHGVISDVDGTLEEWTRDAATIRLDDGGLAVIPAHNIGLLISDGPEIMVKDPPPEQAQRAS